MNDDTNDNDFLENDISQDIDKHTKDNTLDFYNDDMSRKAVGKLFSVNIKDDNEENSADIKEIEENTMEIEEKKEKIIDEEIEEVSETEETTHIDVIKGFEPETNDETSETIKTSGGRDILSESATSYFEEEGYNFSLYRKKGDKELLEQPLNDKNRQFTKTVLTNNNLQDYDGEHTMDKNKPENQNKINIQDGNEEEKPRKVYKKIEPRKIQPIEKTEDKPAQRTEDRPTTQTPKRRPMPEGEPGQRPSPEARPKQRQRPDGKPQGIKYPPGKNPRPTKKTRYPSQDRYDDRDEYTDEKLPIKTFIMVGIVIALVLSMGALVFALNSANSKLEEANVQIDELATFKVQAIDLTQQNESLKNENATLKAEIERLSATATVTTEGVEDSVDATNSSTDTNATTNTSTPNTSTTTNSAATNKPANESSTQSSTVKYTVKSGDTLGKISKDYYGTEADYEKIMDANNLDDADLSVGQVLIIPE